MYKLNLGRFNCCVEYLPKGAIAEYSIDDDTKIICCTAHSENVKLVRILSDSHVTINLFDIGCHCDDGKIDDSKIIDKMMANIELEIMSIIRRICREDGCQYSLNLDDIKIPVKNIEFFDDNRNGGCYGWAQVGIALIQRDKVREAHQCIQ